MLLSFSRAVQSLVLPLSYPFAVFGFRFGQFRDSGKEAVTEKPLWGREKTIVIGQDKISYMALSGDRNPAVLYLPAFDAPALDYKAERLRS